MPPADVRLEKRRQKEQDRLTKKKQKVEDKLEQLEARYRAGKVPTTRYHDKKIDLKRQITGFDRAARKIQGRNSSK